MAVSQTYKVGGSLDGDSAFYVRRAADQELYAHLKAGDTCFVFNSRQMGKSSLRVRTMRRLREDGVVCAVIDPQSRGTAPTEEQWYAGTLKRLIDDLNLAEAVPFSAWWKESGVQALSPVNRFEEFIDKILLTRIAAPIVIFVEEVDNLLSLTFDTDGFFAMIRSLHERRAEHPAYQRLTFCFLGVATPYDLIRGDHRSAFNIGHAVELSGLDRHEAQPLLTGLIGKVADPPAVLDAVLHWSGGQPFLTQKLLALVSASGDPSLAKARRSAAGLPMAALVDAVAREQIIRDWDWDAKDQPVHLRTIRDRLLRGDERHRGRLLGLVQAIQERGGIPADASREQMQLRLTGLVVCKDGQLRFYNPIYAAVFTPDWVRAQLEELRPPIYGEALHAWEAAPAKDRPSYLISGAALRQALAWAKGKSLSPVDQEFLEESRAAEDLATRAAEATRLAEERAGAAEREASTRRKVIMAMGVGLVALGGLSALAWRQMEVAQLREQAALVINEIRTAPVEATIRAIALQSLSPQSAMSDIDIAGDDPLAQALSQSVRWGEVDRLLGHQDAVRDVDISPDGQRIVSASNDQTLRLWEAKTGRPIGPPLVGHGATVRTVDFSPDGQRIVSGSGDATLRLWDGTTGQPIGPPLRGHTSAVLSVAFSPDGRRMVSGSNDKTLRLWDGASGRSLGLPLRGHTGAIRTVAFSPDGRRIVSGSSDNTLRFWDAFSGRPIGPPLRGHTDTVKAVAFSPDGRRIISGSFDRTLRLWDATTGKALRPPLEGHTDWVKSVAFSPNGHHIVSSSSDNTIRLWDGPSGNPIAAPLKGHTNPVARVLFSPDGRSLVSGSFDRTVRLWDANAGQLTSKRLNAPLGVIEAVAFSPDGRRLVSGTHDNALQLWDAFTGQPIGQPFRGRTDLRLLSSLAFSPDGTRLASGSGANSMILWEVRSGKPIGSPFLGHVDSISSVAFSPDSRRIVSGSLDFTLRLWDASTGKPIGSPLLGHSSDVRVVAFSPDGRRIVSGSTDTTLRLWDGATGQPLGRALRGHSGEVRAVAFSPDGRRIVSGSSDRSLRLWDAASGAPIGQPLFGHRTTLKAVAFSPDGRTILSMASNNTLLLWDAATGGLITTALQGSDDSVRAVAFSPNGRRVAITLMDGTAWLVDVTPARHLSLACQRLKRHHRLWQPEAFATRPEWSTITRRAQRVCASLRIAG